MLDYIEALRLRSLHTTMRKMELSLKSHHSTISEFFKRADARNLTWPVPDGTTNEYICSMLYPERANDLLGLRAQPDYESIHKDLAKRGTNLTLLWEEYETKARNAGLIPYKYSQFCDLYRKWAQTKKATMRIKHKPGDAMQVDWAGTTIPITDCYTGEISNAYLFVAVLPCSCYTYAEVCSDMKSGNWLLCHVHAYRYFGGSTRLLIPDNLTTGVTSNTIYETVVNKSYQDLSDHYNTAIVPCRVRHPQDKSLAESSVRFASTWIIAALRERKFFSVSEAQQAVLEMLDKLNKRPFKKLAGCRYDAFINEEREFLQPLPAEDFEPTVWSTAKINRDYLITDGLNKYSVPFNLIGEQVDICLTKHRVEVFFHGAKVATHKRLDKYRKDPVINPDHMTKEHKKFLTYNAEDFKEWAGQIGPHVLKVVEYFLSAGKEPEQGYKPCSSLKRLSGKYDDHLLEEACERVLALTSAPTIKNITLLIKNNNIKVTKEPSSSKPKAKADNSYAFVRGYDYYGKDGDLK